MAWKDPDNGAQPIEALAERLASLVMSNPAGGYSSEVATGTFATQSTSEAVAADLRASVAPETRDGAPLLTVAAESIQKVAQSLQSLTGPLGGIAFANPIVAGLMKLFGSDEQKGSPSMPKFSLPAAQRYEGGVAESVGWRFGEIDRGEGNTPRALTPVAPQQIVVQVQALDSRSFLDHRDEIASAVRQAMLESHSLNDVMREV